MTDSNGALYRQYSYDPYGNLIKMADGSGNPVKDANDNDITTNLQDDPGFNHAYTYRGYRYDAETGLYFLNARYYAAGIGRFLTKDTWKGESTGPQTLNRYAYTIGDPITFVDHSGHRPGVSAGPEGLDVYNSVSETPYRPYRPSISSNNKSNSSQPTVSSRSSSNTNRQYVYDPYGNLIKMADGNGNPVKDANDNDITTNLQDDPGFNHAYTYRGYRYDAESELYFLNARYYAAGIGRFLTKDTWKGESTDPQTLNRYAYAIGDPITFTDHSGHRPGVTAGPEGLDLYNSVSEEPYRPYRQPTISSTPSKAYDVAKTYIAPASRIVTAVGASTALIGSIVAAPGLVPLGIIVGGVGIGLAITLYATGVDTSKLHLAEAVLGAVPLTRTVTVGGVAMGRGLSMLSRADIEAGFVKQAGKAIDSVGALRLFDGALSFGIGASSLKW